MTINHEGKIVNFKRTAENTFCFADVKIIGGIMSELVMPPDMRKHHDCELAQYVATGHSKILNCSIKQIGV